MDKIYRQSPLYKLLQIGEGKEYKTVLDCGAGGTEPPLGMFRQQGYETTGIEIDKNQISCAQVFEEKEAVALNIQYGDMTNLKFDDESFDMVYSYNSIFHMKKTQVEEAINEMKRVLNKEGILFVNFLSVDDFRCGEGPHLGDNQYEQMDDEPVIHAYYDYDEADKMFAGMEFVNKERRIIERIYEGERIKQGFIDYIYKKI